MLIRLNVDKVRGAGAGAIMGPGQCLVLSHRPRMSNSKIRLGTGHDRVTSR